MYPINNVLEIPCMHTQEIPCIGDSLYTYTSNVYKESPWHYLNTEIKDHKFWRFKSHLYVYITITLPNLGIYLHNNILNH